MAEEESALPDSPNITVLLGHGAPERSVNAFRRNGIHDLDALRAVLDAYDGQHWPHGFNPVGIGPTIVEDLRAAAQRYVVCPDHPPTIDTENSIMDWTKPITVENCPPGANLIDLPGAQAKVIGRVVDTEQPCAWHKEDHSTTLRLPTTGLHMPGQTAPVMELYWCPVHKMTGHHLDEKHTDDEIEWGWNHTQVS